MAYQILDRLRHGYTRMGVSGRACRTSSKMLNTRLRIGGINPEMPLHQIEEETAYVPYNRLLKEHARENCGLRFCTSVFPRNSPQTTFRAGNRLSVSRRRFLTTSASAGASLLGAGKAIAAPYQVTVQQEKGVSPKAGSGSNATGLSPQGIPLAIPSTMPMGSGAPLGGIGTGFVEIRADGCFHE